ncbi:hypothetical protein WN51_00727 [Melipona quadrifasciata]|uniref:Uncharacterized protein n=1 Tax=Melipona quadrifasciata TaxID=166423 RepID=A0A0M8ZX96_9HYME|nr:hypothetical protein WN51_00727 [Melipona quadrifasciata]
MSTLGMYELTHPESLSESDLKEILENRCIDFSDYKNLSRFELIELYKRVALPLPQRQSESIQNSDKKQHNEGTNHVDELYRNSVLMNGTSTKTDVNGTTKITESFCVKSKFPVNEFNQTSKKICLHNSNNFTKSNDIDKRINDEKHDVCMSFKYSIAYNQDPFILLCMLCL